MPPAAESNRAASLENTVREEDREEGEEMGRRRGSRGRGGGKQGTQHNNRISPILTMKKMQYQGIRGLASW